MVDKVEGKFHGSVSESLQYIRSAKESILEAVDFVNHEYIRNFSRNLTGKDTAKLLKFEKIKDIYPDVYNKNVIDIGGGLTSLPKTLKYKFGAKMVTIVDPIFNYRPSEFSAVIDDNMSQIQHRLYEGRNTLIPEAKERFIHHKCDIEKWRDPLYTNDLKLNGSLGQEIHGVEDASQDIVLISHVLWKVPHPEKILEEAYRVMTPEGRIYIIDYQIDRWTKGEYFYKYIYPCIHHIIGDASDRRGLIGQKFSTFCHALDKEDLKNVLENIMKNFGVE